MSLIFEVSFECGNKVGGIWKVITSKSKEMKKRFGNEYFTVGFFNPKNYVNEFSDKNPPAWLKKIFDELRKEKIICYYGEWTEANDVQLILVDSKEFENDNVNDIKKELWEKYKIDSLNTGNDFNTPIAWSYAVGKLLEKISRKKDVVAHFHEWLSGAGLLYLKMNNVPVPTVFTTHATSFGRAKTLFLPKEEVKERVPLEEVYKYGVAAKHLTEVACANNADVFTTVSEVMKNEVIYVLGKKPDIITVNALDFSNIPSIDEIQQLNYKLRKKADEFIRAYFSPYYPIDLKNYPIIFTSGRYEFFNKGFDLFIDSIGELNKRLKGTKNLVVVFIFVPTGIIGPKDEVVDNIMTYRRQVKLQEKKLKELFGQKPKIFRNTELIYNDDMGKVVSDMGYKAVMTEGTEKILEWRSPCYVYEASGSNIKLLLKHYRLSDDIAFRFSTPYWNEYPLTADKYASWINATPGNVINIFMDYETFGEHQWKETGIFEFLKHLPREILKNPNNEFVLPSEVIKKFKPVATISVPFLISWADTERDLSAWIGNEMQRTAARELYSLENDVLKTKDKSIISDWRKLQTADHFYYMCTKWFADGDIHKYFNPYESPYEAFISFMNILNDLKNRIRGDSMSKYLENVPDDKVFWCRDGQIFKNLKELLFGLEKMSDETFKFHVSKEKNDFANWIRDVIGDEKLAKDIMKSRTKKSLMKKLSNRIKKLEK